MISQLVISQSMTTSLASNRPISIHMMGFLPTILFLYGRNTYLDSKALSGHTHKHRDQLNNLLEY